MAERCADTDPRPSWRCQSPECGRGPSREGECWLCPRCADDLRAENARLREEFSRDMAALHKAAGLSGAQSLIQELPRLREAAARFAMIQRYLDLTAGAPRHMRTWADIICILDGTTPIPPNLEVPRG